MDSYGSSLWWIINEPWLPQQTLSPLGRASTMGTQLLVGGWKSQARPEKYDESSIGRMIPNISGKMPNWWPNGNQLPLTSHGTPTMLTDSVHRVRRFHHQISRCPADVQPWELRVKTAKYEAIDAIVDVASKWWQRLPGYCMLLLLLLGLLVEVDSNTLLKQIPIVTIDNFQ